MVKESKIPKQEQYTVKEPAGLLQFLLEQLKGKSRTTVKSFLAHRQVSVEHHTITQFDYPLEPGQIVRINYGKIPEEIKYRGLKILYEDQWLIIIEKEAGLLSIATAKEKIQTAYSILSKHVKGESPENKIFVVHRLDRDTSGIMVFAKDQEVQSLLQKSWQEAVMERIYVAVVQGEVEQEEGTISSWLKENKAFVMYSSLKQGDGDLAITHYKVLKKNEEFSLLDVSLETGRKNQIRVHMKDIGHPVIGDKKYGSAINPIGRTALHARVLSFIHPITGKEIRYETAIPSKFLSLFKNK
jgi:23S rRNA pseudouridine1911/1915/1917 synthase